jgi:hypothetical protein
MEDAVDEVFEGSGAGQRAFLGHMADQQHRHVEPLRDLHQRGGRLPHGGDAARCGVADGERLNRVDHADRRQLGLDRRQHRLQGGLGQDRNVESRVAQAARASADLRGRLLAGDV